MHKDKILAQLKVKYPGASIKFLGLTADKLAAKVTEESAIEGAIAELENQTIPFSELVQEYQREGDRRATEALKTKTKEKSASDGGNESQQADTTNTTSSDPNAALLAAINGLKEEMASIKKGQVQNSLKEKLIVKLKDEKKIPEAIAKKIVAKMEVESEEGLETAVETANTDYLEWKQEMVNSGIVSAAPANGSANTSTTTVKAGIEAWGKENEVKTPLINK